MSRRRHGSGRWRGGLRWRWGRRGGMSRRRRGSGRWRGGLRWRRGRAFGDCGGRICGRRVGAGGYREDCERERRDSVYGRAHGWDCSGNLRLASSGRAAARRGLARARAFCRNLGLARNSQKPILGERGADCRRISSAPFSLFSLKIRARKAALARVALILAFSHQGLAGAGLRPGTRARRPRAPSPSPVKGLHG